jgi:signal transduction histidine kinase
VRNRLLVSVVLCALAVVGAGAPGIAAASDDLAESQQLVDQATVNQDAIVLAYALSDERDNMVAYVAGGRAGTDANNSPTGPQGEAARAQVDRLTDEVLASGAVVPEAVRRRLKDLPRLRRQALTGTTSAYDVYVGYSDTIHAVQGVSRSVASGLPGRAENATAAALPSLGHAVEQASAVRGLLRGALLAGGPQKKLTSEAQQAHVRAQSALADFRQTAGTKAQETYDKTVTGSDVGAAERYLTTLTDQPYLDAADHALSRSRIADTLSARIDRMRGVHSSLATAELRRLEHLRDDEVTALEIHVAIVGLCLLIAVGISVQTARSMARPLSVLRRGSARVAADPVGEEPVRFSGRNDEFAEVVRSLNALRATAAEFAERAKEADADNTYLMSSKDELAAERERLLTECQALRERVETAPGAMQGTFLHLAVRSLGLVERQLSVIESMEADESDPERLSTLFTLDHLATRMRRHGENLLLLAGTDAGHPHGGDAARGPVPLLDVLRAAVSEIERYERVAIGSLPPHAQLSGHAADDVSHLVAELLDNATSFSPPDDEVQLSGWMLENGEVMLSVQDEGIGMTGERLNELNTRLGMPDAQQPPAVDNGDGRAGLGNGLYVVARLAARHGLRVQLRRQRQGGIAAVVVLPRAILPDRPVPGVPSGATAGAQGGAGAPSMPGSVAEANSNTLPSRHARALPHTPPVPGPAAPEPADPPPGAGQVPPARTSPDEVFGSPATPATPATDPVAGPAPSAGEPWEPQAPEVGAPAAPGTAQGDVDAAFGGPAPRVTDKGLPKRTPRHVEAQTDLPRPRKSGANAEELRRRLGGFQRGARDGHRDAAAETVAERPRDDEEAWQ